MNKQDLIGVVNKVPDAKINQAYNSILKIINLDNVNLFANYQGVHNSPELEWGQSVGDEVW